MSWWLVYNINYERCSHMDSLTHWHASDGRRAKTYIYQFWADTGCSVEDMPGMMNDWDRWWGRSGNAVLSVQIDDDDDDDIY